MLETSILNYLNEYLICGSVALRDDVYYLSSTHPDVSNTYTIHTHKEGERINVSKVHLVCRVMTLCVTDPIWGVCHDSYTLLRERQISNPFRHTHLFTHYISPLLPWGNSLSSSDHNNNCRNSNINNL